MVNDRVVVAFTSLSDTAHDLIHRLVVRVLEDEGERVSDG